jgi:hypothetical protein
MQERVVERPLLHLKSRIIGVTAALIADGITILFQRQSCQHSVNDGAALYIAQVDKDQIWLNAGVELPAASHILIID